MMEILILWLIEFQMLELGLMLLIKKAGSTTLITGLSEPKYIEDKLSDKLHEELTKSFVDKRISVLSRSLKQDIILATEIKNENEVIIDGQYIGRLKGLKLDLDLKSGSLKTDIKSLKKAARQAIAPELMRRTNRIIKSEVLELDDDHKIYWMDNPIAYIYKEKII